MKGIKQHETRDCGLACLATVFSHYGLQISLVKLRTNIRIEKNGLSLYDLVQISKKYNFKSKVLNGSMDELKKDFDSKTLCLPIIAHVLINHELLHYVVVKEITSKTIRVFDPAKGYINYSYADFINIWTGYIICIEPDDDFKKCNLRKGEYKKYYEVLFSLKFVLAITLVLSLLISGISIISTMIYQKLIDDYILQAESISMTFDINRNNMLSVCILFLGITFFNILLNFIRGHLLLGLSKKAASILSSKYYSKLMKLPIIFFQNRDAGEIMSRYQDIDEIHSLMSEASLAFVLNSTMILIGGGILYHYNAILFSIIVVMLSIYFLIVLCYGRILQEKNKQVKENFTKVNSFLKDSIDGIETIKLNTKEEAKKESFSILQSDMLESDYQLGKISLRLNSLVDGIEDIGVILILCCGSLLVMQNQMTLGELVTFDALLYYFIGPVKELISLQPIIQRAKVIFDRLNDVYEYIEEDDLQKRDNIDILKWNKIKMENVSFSYGYGKNVISQFNLEIERGKTLAITGKSGCGKSTLAKLLLALEVADQGIITIDNIDINTISLKEIRSNIAYVPQKVFLFNGTIKSNLGIEETPFNDEVIMQILKGCKITEFTDSVENNIEYFVCENGKNLSGGQRQRIAIARALLRNPNVLILDEATNQLDTECEREILEFIRESFPDILCIYITHNIRIAQQCDYVVSM